MRLMSFATVVTGCLTACSGDASQDSIVAPTSTAVVTAGAGRYSPDEELLLLNPKTLSATIAEWIGPPRVARLEVTVSRAGRVVAAVPLGEIPEDTRSFVARAIGAMEFAPARIRGEPITSRTELTILLTGP